MSVPSPCGTWWSPSPHLVAFCLHIVHVQCFTCNEHVVLVGLCTEARVRQHWTEGKLGELSEHHAVGRGLM